MRNFILLICILISLFAVTALAETRYYSVRSGLVYYNGNIPYIQRYGTYSNCDPIYFSYQHEKYYMIKDNSDKIFSRESLLGCEDWSRATLFDPLIQMNSDNIWERLTPDEIRKANVRFVKLKLNGELDTKNKENDFDLNQIAYIDLNRLSYTTSITPNGDVNMYLKTPYGNLKRIVIHISAMQRHLADRMFK